MNVKKSFRVIALTFSAIFLTTTVQAFAAETIKIGFIEGLSGPFADVGAYGLKWESTPGSGFGFRTVATIKTQDTVLPNTANIANIVRP